MHDVIPDVIGLNITIAVPVHSCAFLVANPKKRCKHEAHVHAHNIAMMHMQVAVSLLNDFALVYLLAPTPECSVLKRGSLRARLAELPAHVFQRAPAGLER